MHNGKVVRACEEAAHAAGVREGMSLNAALALVPDMHALARDARRDVAGRNVTTMPNVLGAFGTVRNFMNIVKEVDFDAVRGRAETPPSVLVCASDETLASSFVRQVFGDQWRHGPRPGRII